MLISIAGISSAWGRIRAPTNLLDDQIIKYGLGLYFGNSSLLTSLYLPPHPLITIAQVLSYFVAFLSFFTATIIWYNPHTAEAPNASLLTLTLAIYEPLLFRNSTLTNLASFVKLPYNKMTDYWLVLYSINAVYQGYDRLLGETITHYCHSAICFV